MQPVEILEDPRLLQFLVIFHHCVDAVCRRHGSWLGIFITTRDHQHHELHFFLLIRSNVQSYQNELPPQDDLDPSNPTSASLNVVKINRQLRVDTTSG